MYLPPLLEKLGLAELTHDARNNRMRALSRVRSFWFARRIAARTCAPVGDKLS